MSKKPTYEDLAGRVKELEDEVLRLRDTEEALRECEERYRELFLHAPAAIYEVDYKDYKFLRFNDVMCAYTGYSRDELMEMSSLDFLTEEGIRTFSKRMGTMAEGSDPPLTEEYEIRKKDGTTMWAMFTVMYEMQGGVPVKSRTIAHDITERKLKEEALLSREERFRSLLEKSSDWIWEIDENGAYTYSSPGIKALLGYEPEEIIGRTPFDLMPPDEADRAREEFSNTVEGRRTLDRVENVDLHKDGRRVVLETSGVPIFDDAGNMVGYRGIDRDITDRKIAEEVLQKAIEELQQEMTERQRAEQGRRALEERLKRAEKMEALGTLAGGVAHDLNNVLGVLVGYSELLELEIPNGSPLRRHVSNIHQSGLRGSAIVQDLLTMARRGVTVSETVNLNDIVEAYLETPELAELKVIHPGMSILAELEPTLLSIKGSPVHLSKTVMNLVSNAAEALPDQGEVTIKTGNLYLDRPLQGYDDFEEGEYAIVSVSDNGEGISGEDIERIFEPFYTKKVLGRSGTGLGLAVVWGTVKDHNGHVDVESHEGRGTTFTLYFPITREQAPDEHAAVTRESYLGQGETILVVDDVMEQRNLARAMLQPLGYHIVTVESGEKAVEYLKTEPADLVLLDMIMDPGIDGLETYRRMLALRPNQKAIVVSGFSETDRVKKTQELGAGEYVRKPYVLEQIGLAIRRELDRPSDPSAR